MSQHILVPSAAVTAFTELRLAGPLYAYFPSDGLWHIYSVSNDGTGQYVIRESAAAVATVPAGVTTYEAVSITGSLLWKEASGIPRYHRYTDGPGSPRVLIERQVHWLRPASILGMGAGGPQFILAPSGDAAPNPGSPVPSSPATHYDKVRQNPHDGDTTRIRQLAIGDIEAFGLDVESLVNDPPIYSVATRWAQAGDSDSSAHAGFRIGGAYYTSLSRGLPVNMYATFNETPLLTNPATGVPWTKQAIAAMQIIHQQDTMQFEVGYPRLTQLVAVVVTYAEVGIAIQNGLYAYGQDGLYHKYAPQPDGFGGTFLGAVLSGQTPPF